MKSLSKQDAELARRADGIEDPAEQLSIRRVLAEKYPDNPYCLAAVANCYRRMGEVERAEREYERIRARWPEKPYGYEGLALIRIDQGKVGDAIALVEEAFRCGSRFGYLFHEIARQFEHLDRREEAATWYLRAFQVEPHEWQALESYCRLIGRVFFSPVENMSLSPDAAGLAGLNTQKLLAYLDGKRCDHTFRNFDRWLDEHRFDRISGYLWAICNGGFCDCEIAYNVNAPPTK